MKRSASSRALGALAVACLLAAAPVAAQPVPLVPGGREAPAPPPAAPREGRPVDAGGVVISPLKPLDPDSLGTLAEGGGGLGIDVWRGSRRSTVEQLIALLPAAPSPAAGELARRLLLSAAEVPEGPGGGRSLLALRAERLLASGRTAAAAELARLAPAEPLDPALQRVVVDAAWLADRPGDACTAAQRMLRVSQDPEWLKSSVLCRARAKETAEAHLALSLLRDQGVDDAPFLTLATALLAGAKPRLDKLAQPTALHVALLRETAAALPAGPPADASPAALAAIAALPGASPEQRLAAAERAEAAGALPTADLARLYAATEFSEAERRESADRISGARAAAWHFQTVAAKTEPAARAEALRRALALGRDRGLYATAARANLAALRALAPSPELMPFAADILRALVAAAEEARAAEWWQALRAATAESDEAAAAVAAAWPLAMVAGIADAGWNDTLYERWQAALRGRDKDDPARRDAALFVMALGEALGAPPAAARWEDVYALRADENGVAPAALLGLPRAVAAGARGETVLLALLALGEGGAERAGIGTLAAAVAALRRVGLERDARRIAVEAALARGL